VWAIAEGYIPGRSNGPQPEMASHESLSVLNAGERDARVAIEVYYADRDPVVYEVEVPARRTRHFRLDELTNPEPIPKATEFSSVVRSDVPVVVQHTRLDSRQAENALISTVAFPCDEATSILEQ
jgi:hypothetical protein